MLMFWFFSPLNFFLGWENGNWSMCLKFSFLSDDTITTIYLHQQLSYIIVLHKSIDIALFIDVPVNKRIIETSSFV